MSTTKGTAMTENNVSNEIATRTDREMAGLTGARKDFMSTFDATTQEGKVQLYNAMSDPTPVSDNLGKTIPLTGFVAQTVEYADEDGVMQEGVRIILVDKDGKAYSAMSSGLVKAVRNLVGIFGEPAGWKEPINIKVVEEGKKPRAYFTIKLA